MPTKLEYEEAKRRMYEDIVRGRIIHKSSKDDLCYIEGVQRTDGRIESNGNSYSEMMRSLMYKKANKEGIE